MHSARRSFTVPCASCHWHRYGGCDAHPPGWLALHRTSSLIFPRLPSQQNNGVLNESAARLVVIGTGPVPPPPRMAGLEAPAKEPVKQWTQPAAAGAPTGAQYGAPPTAAAGGLPLLTQQDFQRFQGMFMQLDTDRDGRVQVGGEHLCMCVGSYNYRLLFFRL